MIYQTGSSTTILPFFEVFKDFCQNVAGYTVNRYGGDASGLSLCIAKNGTMFFNFKAYVDEVVPAFANQTGIFMNGSTSFNSGQLWYNQPAALSYNDGTTKYLMAGMVNLTGTINSYHLFHQSGSDYDTVYAFVESPVGIWQRIMFGRMSTGNFGTTWTGNKGNFFCGSKSPADTNYSLSLNLFGNTISQWNSPAPQGAVYGLFNITTDWMSGNLDLNNSWFSPPRYQIVDSISKQSSIWLNMGGSVPILQPINLLITRSTSNMTPTSQLSLIGNLPNTYWVNMRDLTAGQTIKFPSAEYLVFPLTKKSDTWDSTNPNNGTYNFGLAVLKA
jgi:hypothetical protein